MGYATESRWCALLKVGENASKFRFYLYIEAFTDESERDAEHSSEFTQRTVEGPTGRVPMLRCVPEDVPIALGFHCDQEFSACTAHHFQVPGEYRIISQLAQATT